MGGMVTSFMKMWHWNAPRKVVSEMPERGLRSQWRRIFEKNFEIFRRDPNDFLSQMLTMDETWLYHYDSETKQQSICWGKRVTPPQEITSENSRLDFCDQGDILLIDYLPRCQNINAEYYSTLLAEIKDSLKGKRRGNFTDIVCFAR